MGMVLLLLFSWLGSLQEILVEWWEGEGQPGLSSHLGR